jgi:hypothetical protein
MRHSGTALTRAQVTSAVEATAFWQLRFDPDGNKVEAVFHAPPGADEG